jgi:DNA-binding HxlR family transcriptional regulator
MWLVLSLAAFLCSGLLHAAVMRCIDRAGAVAAFVMSGAAMGAVLVGYCVLKYGLSAATLAAILTYAFACEIYIFLFTLVGTSVSCALLVKLASRPLRTDEIASFYRTEAMIERRLKQLERSNLIAADEAGFRLTARGKTIVRIFSFFRALFRRPALAGVTNDL